MKCCCVCYHITGGFYLIEKYPMIISTPRNPYHANAQSPNRSSGTCAPEFTVFPQKDCSYILFISVLPQCGVCSKLAFYLITCTRVRATLYLYLYVLPSTFIHQFPADTMTDHEEFVFVCSFVCTSRPGSLLDKIQKRSG